MLEKNPDLPMNCFSDFLLQILYSFIPIHLKSNWFCVISYAPNINELIKYFHLSNWSHAFSITIHFLSVPQFLAVNFHFFNFWDIEISDIRFQADKNLLIFMCLSDNCQLQIWVINNSYKNTSGSIIYSEGGRHLKFQKIWTNDLNSCSWFTS